MRTVFLWQETFSWSQLWLLFRWLLILPVPPWQHSLSELWSGVQVGVESPPHPTQPVEMWNLNPHPSYYLLFKVSTLSFQWCFMSSQHMALPHILSVAQSYRSYHWSMFKATPSPDLHSDLQHLASTGASKLGHLALILQINPLKPKFDQATEPYKNLQFFHRT